jgi:GxxExxY protein
LEGDVGNASWDGEPEFSRITSAIIEAAIRIHRDLGPGLMESVYEALMAHTLRERGFRVRRQHALRLEYAGITFDEAFRADLIVEDTVIVEIKSVVRADPVFARQLLTYLRLSKLPLGLLINFGGITLREGIKRVINVPREA